VAELRSREESPGAAAGAQTGADTRVLLIGEGRLTDATERALGSGPSEVRRLHAPTDREIREALEEQHTDRVIVVSRFDHVSLRLALVVAHVRPGIPVLATIFDHDVAAHLEKAVENVHVLSMADLVAPAFAGPCLDPGLLSLIRSPAGVEGVRAVDGEPRHAERTWPTPGRARRALAAAEGVARPFASSAQILVAGLAGVIGVLVVETLVTILAEGQSPIDAFYSVAKVTVTVGPSEAAEHGPDWFKLFSAASMLLSLAFIAVFTAGLVNRLLDPRLTGIVGRSAVPRRDHVVVVGLGQVGLRLCGLLRDLGVPVVAVEQNPDAKNVPRAKDQRLPVVIGSGSSQQLLRRLSIARARALAAVTSDEVENIAIAVAARGARDDIHVTFRAGDGELTSETRSLFQIGVVRDIYWIAGTALAAAALGYDVHGAFPYKGQLYLVDRAGRIEPFVAHAPR
jgi:Trk K+ transport system NAD-binding subunit